MCGGEYIHDSFSERGYDEISQTILSVRKEVER
jgi:hypothetical protein